MDDVEDFLVCIECEGDSWSLIVDDPDAPNLVIKALRCSDCGNEIEATPRLA